MKMQIKTHFRLIFMSSVTNLLHTEDVDSIVKLITSLGLSRVSRIDEQNGFVRLATVEEAVAEARIQEQYRIPLPNQNQEQAVHWAQGYTRILELEATRVGGYFFGCFPASYFVPQTQKQLDPQTIAFMLDNNMLSHPIFVVDDSVSAKNPEFSPLIGNDQVLYAKQFCVEYLCAYVSKIVLRSILGDIKEKNIP